MFQKSPQAFQSCFKSKKLHLMFNICCYQAKGSTLTYTGKKYILFL